MFNSYVKLLEGIWGVPIWGLSHDQGFGFNNSISRAQIAIEKWYGLVPMDCIAHVFSGVYLWYNLKLHTNNHRFLHGFAWFCYMFDMFSGENDL